jgi:hypothetical protein
MHSAAVIYARTGPILSLPWAFGTIIGSASIGCESRDQRGAERHACCALRRHQAAVAASSTRMRQTAVSGELRRRARHREHRADTDFQGFTSSLQTQLPGMGQGVFHPNQFYRAADIDQRPELFLGGAWT